MYLVLVQSTHYYEWSFECKRFIFLMKYFILFTTATMMIETVSFSQFHSNLLLRRQIPLTQFCNLSVLTPRKGGVRHKH